MPERGFILDLKTFTRVAVAALATSATAAAFATTAATAQAAAAPGTLAGAGSTLVAPLEAEWANAFDNATGNTVTYNPVGSGTGIKDISGGLVDFGASDAPLTPSQAASCANCIQIPWGLSATGVGFHINGIHKLQLTGSVLANIYMGHITNWDDPAIAKLNKGEHMPNLKITPVFRTDGSGDTYAFTNYLSHISGAWSHGVGTSTSVSFPAGVGGAKNAGVTSILESTNGAVAYIAVSYLIAHSLPAAAVKNSAGKYEYPNLNNIENAARTVKHVPASNALSIVDPPKSAKIAYPISTFTYVIVPTTAKQGALLRQFISYCLGAGQKFGPALDFAGLPSVVKNAGEAAVGKIQ
jgi:phosphate transport system substrate-binding protein